MRSVVVALVLIAACSSSSTTTGGAADAGSTSSSGGSSGGGSSGEVTSSSGSVLCPPEPEGTQSATFLPCGEDAGGCSPLDLDSKALTFCSTTVYDIGWRPPELTSDVCGPASGASIGLIGENFCGIGAVSPPGVPPALTKAVQPIDRAAYFVRTKDANEFVVWISSQHDGLAIQFIEAAKLRSN